MNANSVPAPVKFVHSESADPEDVALDLDVLVQLTRSHPKEEENKPKYHPHYTQAPHKHPGFLQTNDHRLHPSLCR